MYKNDHQTLYNTGTLSTHKISGPELDHLFKRRTARHATICNSMSKE